MTAELRPLRLGARTTHGVRTIAVTALVTLVLTSPAAFAGASETTTDVANNVMSPFCPGLTLHDCPSDAAAELRARIERWARDGMSRDEIMIRLRDEYGPAISATPERAGAGLLAWLLPAAAVALGAAVAWRLARRWSSRPGPAPEPHRGSASDDERRRLEAELAELRRAT
jgi:cytochrome c-type biogenesis protein CcmH